jgi:hypothetical protein
MKADALAAWYCKHGGRQQSLELADHQPSTQVSISINGRRITSQIEGSLRFHINGDPLRIYLQSKHRWDNLIWEMINIWSFERFVKTLHPAQHTFYIKLAPDHLYLGERRYLMVSTKEHVLRICPCCKSNFEDTTHFLRCLQNPARSDVFAKFKSALQCHGDPYPVTFLFAYGITKWLHDEPIDDPDL